MALHKDVMKYIKPHTDEYHKYCGRRVLLNVGGSTVIIKLQELQHWMETMITIVIFKLSWKKEGVLLPKNWTFSVFRQLKNNKIFKHGTFGSV